MDVVSGGEEGGMNAVVEIEWTGDLALQQWPQGMNGLDDSGWRTARNGTMSQWKLPPSSGLRTPKMLLPGRLAVPRIIKKVRSAKVQVQSCGVDLTLKRVKTWTSPGIIDFDNDLRLTASAVELPFIKHQGQFKKLLAKDVTAMSMTPSSLKKHMAAELDSVMLETGSYLVEFNETVDMPLDLMGQVFVRSSLFRSGALLSAGAMDSGYEGAVGAMLQVVNPHGLLLFKDARLAQMIFHQMSERVEGYSGVYQGSGSI
ncbi:MAG: hypothetical protein LQ341_006134 [Variospora aurantia]|nr:MAG: hypothetical protein LQ341_006134 [Variospora aurantia]